MGIYRRLKQLDDRISRSPAAQRLHHLLEQLLPLVVVTLIVVLYLEFFVHLSPPHHDLLIRAEQVILAYFILELAVKLGLHTDNKQFVRNNWLDILLVIPFFAAVSGITRLLRALKGLKAFKGVKAVKSAKAAKGVKATKATKGVKLLHGKKIARFSKHGKKAQHGAKAVKKSKEVVEEVSEHLLNLFRD